MPGLKDARIRHASYYSSTVAAVAETLLRNPAEVDADYENFLQAVEFCLEIQDWELLLKYTKSLGRYWLNSGDWDVLRRCVLSLLHGDLQNASERADALSMLIEAEETQGNYSEARLHLRQQISILDQIEANDPGRQNQALKVAVNLARLQGDVREAQQLLERLYKSAQEQRNYKEQVNSLLALAQLLNGVNELDRADLMCHQGLSIARRIRYTIGTMDLLRTLALTHQARQQYKDASICYKEALSLAKEAGDHIREREIREQLSNLEAIMGQDIFISYNHHDHDFVERLATDLKMSGLSVWWDEWEIKVGDSIIQKVSDGIQRSAHLMVVLSPHSVQSPWVQRELGSALMKHLSAERGIIVLPLLVADCEIPILLREIKYADFRHDYQAALHALLKAVA